MGLKEKVPSLIQEYKKKQDVNRLPSNGLSKHRVSSPKSGRAPKQQSETPLKTSEKRTRRMNGCRKDNRRKRAGQVRATTRRLSKSMFPNKVSKVVFAVILVTLESVDSLEIKPINERHILGEDVRLKCSFQKSTNKQDHVQWLTGAKKSLTLGNSSINDTKYIPNLVNDGNTSYSILTIRNVTSSDFNTYICQHDFEETSYTLDRSTFVYIAMKNETNIVINPDDESTDVVLTLDNVFSEPFCSVHSKMGTVRFKKQVQNSNYNSLYKIEITVNIGKNATICKYKMVMNCSLSDDIHDNASILKEQEDCNVTSTPNGSLHDDNEASYIAIYVTVAVAFIICLMFGVAVFCIAKNRTSLCLEYVATPSI